MSIEYIDPTGFERQLPDQRRPADQGWLQPPAAVPGARVQPAVHQGSTTARCSAPNLFGDGIGTFSSLDLKADNNASWQWGSDKSTFLREVWSRDAQQAAGDTQLHSRRVQLFLNGQYWGSYTLIERMSQDQAAAMFGGSPAATTCSSPTTSPATRPTRATTPTGSGCGTLTADQVVTDAEYAEIDSLIDVRSLARMIAINAYAANVDAAPSVSLSSALGNNWLAVGGGGVKYKFLITDAELSLGVDQNDQHDPNVDLWGPYPVLGATTRTTSCRTSTPAGCTPRCCPTRSTE